MCIGVPLPSGAPGGPAAPRSERSGAEHGERAARGGKAGGRPAAGVLPPGDGLDL